MLKSEDAILGRLSPIRDMTRHTSVLTSCFRLAARKPKHLSVRSEAYRRIRNHVAKDLRADPRVEELLEKKRPVHEEIPWPKFSEDEIIYFLMEHFACLRFNVHSPHFADPGHEIGIDIEATKGNEKIVVAVKKRPQNSDRGQLTDLGRAKASRRLYVYISSPTEGFRRDMVRKRQIEFWNRKDLTIELVKSGLVFPLIFDNSVLYNALMGIFSTFAKWAVRPGKETMPEVTPDRLSALWGVKDRLVTLNKGSGLIQIVLERGYERRLEKKDIDLVDELLDLCSTALHKIYWDAAHPVLRALLSSPNILSIGARNTYNADRARSDWKGVFAFLNRSVSIPGRILGDERPPDRMPPIVFKGEPLSALRMDQASSIFRILSSYALDLESILDDIFDVYLGRPKGSHHAEGNFP